MSTFIFKGVGVEHGVGPGHITKTLKKKFEENNDHLNEQASVTKKNMHNTIHESSACWGFAL